MMFYSSEHFEICIEKNNSDRSFLVFTDLFQTHSLYSNTITTLAKFGTVIWVSPKLNSLSSCHHWSNVNAKSYSNLVTQLEPHLCSDSILITQGIGRQISLIMDMKFTQEFHLSPIFSDNFSKILFIWTQIMQITSKHPASYLERILETHWRDSSNFSIDESVPWIHTDGIIQDHFNHRLSWGTWYQVFRLINKQHRIRHSTHWFIGSQSPQSASSLQSVLELESSFPISWKIFSDLRMELLLASDVIHDIITLSRKNNEKLDPC